ncbi:MAG: outer membrane protein assembly factor BamA [Desulfobacterales bacterium]
MKRLCLFLGWLQIWILLSGSASAQPDVSVMVLPFEVFAPDEMNYLATDLPEILGRHLQDGGASLVLPAEKPESGEVAVLREAGQAAGVEYVVSGSVTWVGERFSIDARLLDSFEPRPPKVFHIEGEGVENLSGKVRELADQLSVDLFGLVKIADIRIEGNERIETDAIRRAIRIRTGDTFSAKAITEDLKSIHRLGYFDDVRADTVSVPDGRHLVFKVKEKATIRGIRIRGNSVYDGDAIRQNLTISTGSVLNLANVRSSIERIEEMYKEKNYHNVSVEHEIESLDNNQVNVVFDIDEGGKVRIETIRFEGNKTFSDKQLRKKMQSKEKGFFYWLTASGDLDTEKLAQDVVILQQFYQTQGYINARVSDPTISFEDDGIEILVKISEGDRYRLGSVSVTGDLIAPEEEIKSRLQVSEEEYFNRELLQKDILTLTDFYGEEGFAYADIRPKIDQDNETLEVDVEYRIDKGNLVYFDEIIIGGNTKTLDKVIRRQLKIYEQELYNGSELKYGIQRLHRLDYFQDIKVNTIRGGDDDRMTLKLDVEEKPTGMISFGGGFSSVDNLFGVVSVEERNLFGRGQFLGVKGQLGGTSTRYDIRFTEPWLFDIPLSASVTAYKWEYEYDEYDKDSTGVSIAFGYPVFRYTRVILGYEFDITDIQITDREEVSRNIERLEGENTKSSVTGTVRYDSTDHDFNPTRGSIYSFSTEYAGLGGDIAFTKVTGEMGWYIPFWEYLTGAARVKSGYVTQNEDGKLPDYERFYLGGINTIRGVDRDDINPREFPDDDDSALIGGDKFIVFNFELIFPLSKDIGLMGVAFSDIGDVYDNDEDIDPSTFVKTVGAGIRWFSPFGPIRLEYGFVVDAGDTDASGGKFEFTMGRVF